MPVARDDPGRNKTEEQRSDRNLTDLLQELRVAGLGVQVLFGFLLSLPFTARFSDLDGQRRVASPCRSLALSLWLRLLGCGSRYR
jgi:hypothetical protein